MVSPGVCSSVEALYSSKPDAPAWTHSDAGAVAADVVTWREKLSGLKWTRLTEHSPPHDASQPKYCVQAAMAQSAQAGTSVKGHSQDTDCGTAAVVVVVADEEEVERRKWMKWPGWRKEVEEEKKMEWFMGRTESGLRRNKRYCGVPGSAAAAAAIWPRT